MSSTTLAPDRPTARYVAHVMNMPISLAMRGIHAFDAPGQRAWQRVIEELREVDRIFSTYRPDSSISQLGRGEIQLGDCPAVVREVLALGERARIESLGAFSIWRPLADGTLRLDPSGVVKGWATQRAAQHLAVLAHTDYCLSAGGDMTCRTLEPGAAPWRIGIEDPFDPARIRAVVPIGTGAVATSGGAHRGAHIYDGRRGTTPDRIASVTVVAESLAWADIDATAAFALGLDAPDWLRQRPGRSGVLVWADGRTETVAASGS